MAALLDNDSCSGDCGSCPVGRRAEQAMATGDHLAGRRFVYWSLVCFIAPLLAGLTGSLLIDGGPLAELLGCLGAAIPTALLSAWLLARHRPLCRAPTT